VSDAAPVAKRRNRIRSWTLRRRLARTSVAAAVLFAALFTTIVLSMLNFKNEGDEVIERWQPALRVSQDLLTDLVNQETGVRGYALGGDRDLLQPYTQFLPAERRNEARLQHLLAGRRELLRSLAGFRTAAESWRSSVAAPFIERADNGDPAVAGAVGSEAAKAAFDKVRRASARLSDDIGRTGDRALGARVTAVRLVWVAVGVSAGLILLAGVLLWRALRTAVLAPVEALAGQTRVIAHGNLDREISPSGPPEFAALGRDVDAMRARIAEQLAGVEAARLNLIERSEELARSNADLEQFAYVASHDLSEPLRKVANFCQLLERQYADQLDDKAKQYIAYAVDGAKRMQILIGDLLAFSRVGRNTDRFQPVDMDQVLSRALANLDERIAARDAEIVRSPLPTLTGDATLLVALFQNLVGNAVKYASPERRPRVEIHAEPQDGQWLFTVADNGIGIDPQYAERIFAIFQRLHLRDQYGGTGIGLALCRKIVEFHKGRIWLADDAGPGASFQFTLPGEIGRRSPAADGEGPDREQPDGEQPDGETPDGKQEVGG
jgi:signal transduction histidine kinase